MIPFDFQPRTRIVFGPDSILELGNLASELGARRALVVSDRGVIKAGHTQKGLDALNSAGIETILYDDVKENPSTDNVNEGAKIAQRHEIELIVGLGGGSAMDCAKGINFIYSNGGEMKDYWGVGKALKEMLPLIAVPTTAGTGSEAQSFALISDSETHVKMACGDKKASCRIAVLDPKLTVSQPASITALTGIDAVAHALETFVTTKRNSCSMAFSREAWRLLAGNFAKVVDDPTNLEARGSMQLGACFAGMAIENSMLGATHALANPLTTHYGIAHGQAVAVMLPHVIRYNGQVHADWYQELLQVDDESNDYPPAADGVEGLANFITQLAQKAGLATNLTQLSVDREKIDELAEHAATQWTGTFNPREVGKTELAYLYSLAF